MGLRFWFMDLFALLLVGCSMNTGGQAEDFQDVDGMQTTEMTYPDLGQAPEIANEVWINADSPITLADLRGRVVMLEFWTFDCINCRRTLPYVNQWANAYGGDSFAVLGIHYPEFAHEREYASVVDAVERFAIPYPVALDNDGQTWRAYGQRFWPTTYLIDRNGRIRYKHIGEFNQATAAAFAEAIEALLTESLVGMAR